MSGTFNDLKTGTSSTFNTAVTEAFNAYKGYEGSSWFGLVLTELAEFNKKDPGKLKSEDVKQNTKTQKELDEQLKLNTQALGEGQDLNIETILSLDTAKLQQLGLDETFVTKLKKATNIGAETFNKLHDGYKGVEKLLNNLGGAHQEYFEYVQKSFGGTADLMKESSIGMSRDAIEAYENIGKSVLMTNEELRDNPILRADSSMFPEILPDGSVEVLKNQANEYLRIVKDPADAATRFLNLQKEFAFTYQEKFTGAFKEGTAMLELETIAQSMGAESDQIAKIISRSIDQTGKASIQNFKDIVKFSMSAQEATGVSGKIIFENFADIKADVQNFGNVLDEEASRIAAQLAEVGIRADTLGKLISKFSDFDTAASAVGNLTAAFGLNVDAMEMMMLANTDQEEFLMTMRSQFEEQGLAFEDMNLAQQKLLAGQLGIGIEEAARLFDFDQDITSLEDLKAAQEDMPEEDAFKLMKESALSFSQTGAELQAKIDKTSSFGIGSKMVRHTEQLRREMRETGVAIGTMASRAQQSITTELYGAINEGYDSAAEKLENLKNKLEGITTKQSDIDMEKTLQNAQVAGVAYSNASHAKGKEYAEVEGMIQAESAHKRAKELAGGGSGVTGVINSEGVVTSLGLGTAAGGP